MLAAGSGLIEDIRKAPDDVLSRGGPASEVCWRAKQSVHTQKNFLGHSTRIHTKSIDTERQIRNGRTPFQINAGCCSYFQGILRRARNGYG